MQSKVTISRDVQSVGGWGGCKASKYITGVLLKFVLINWPQTKTPAPKYKTRRTQDGVSARAPTNVSSRRHRQCSKRRTTDKRNMCTQSLKRAHASTHAFDSIARPTPASGGSPSIPPLNDASSTPPQMGTSVARISSE